MAEQKNKNPLVTFALIHYNQENLVKSAMKAALAQDYSPLEIIVSDDCSTDRTWDVMQEIAKSYSGPHQLHVVRNQVNMGIGPHVGKIGLMAQGGLIVQADGDDISYPQRVSRLVQRWRENDFCSGALHSAVVRKSMFDEAGTVLQSPAMDSRKANLEYFSKNHFRAILNGSSIAYTKDVFEKFPPIQAPFEDILLTLRALLIGKLMYFEEPLLDYYLDGGSVSRPLKRSDRARVISWFEIIERNIIAMERDYLYYTTANNSISMHMGIIEEFSSIKKKCRQAIGLASSNPMRIIEGMIAYPYDVPLKQRVAFHLQFFGFWK